MSPISGSAYAKIISFLILLAGFAILPLGTVDGTTFLILFGVPFAVAVGGLYVSHTKKTASPAKSAGRLISIVSSLLTAALLALALYVFATDGWNTKEILIAALFPFGIAVSAHFLFIEAVAPHADWIAEHGLFSARSKIVRMERFKSFSVADELTKWSKLHEDGVVSDEEFEAAKKSLLG